MGLSVAIARIAIYGSRHAQGQRKGSMECPYGWMTDLSLDEGEGKGWDLETELEMQIWRWALLEAHLREASIVYERLMGSPLAPTDLERAERPTWDRGTAPHQMETRGSINSGGGRSQGRRQRRRLLQHQKRGARNAQATRDREWTEE